MYNKLYSSILKTEWAIAPDAWLLHLEYLRALANHDLAKLQTPEELKPEMVIHYQDESGRKYNHRSEDLENMPEEVIAVIEVIGAFTKYGNLCSYGMADIAVLLNQSLRNQKVLGVVLLIDSPGGAANAIAPLTNLIQTRKKPIVSLVDQAGSAGYYVASQTDYIMADNNISSAFGSIGVMISLADVTPKLEAEGIKFHTVYAPESEHKNEAFQLLLQGKYEKIKTEMLSPMARQFQADVRNARGVKLKEDTEGLLSGKMFYARDAIKFGLADGFGDLQAAFDKVRQLAKGYTLRNQLSNV